MNAENASLQPPLSIAMLAAEAFPYAKVGGLGDVIGALPKALRKYGVKCMVIIPGYRSALSSEFNVKPCNAIPSFEIPFLGSMQRIEIFQATDAETEIYFTGSRGYFDRDGIYDDPATKEGFADNMQRFILFTKAALELLKRLGRPMDIIHCHDSHTALTPGLIDEFYRSDPLFSRVGTLFTIHNLAYQGIYSRDALDCAGIGQDRFYSMSPYEFWGQVNFMKAGIELADKLSTVSRKYAEEIQSDPARGMGLEGALRNRKDDISGIINGIDYDEWNPEQDPLIPAHFSAEKLSGKSECKKHLLQLFGLPLLKKRIPLVGIVSRLDDQKGFDLIEEAAEEILSLDLQMVILGTGRPKYHALFERLVSQYPKKISARLIFDNDLAHKIEAGCDLFLMPSRFEPCGLNQLYSLRYGTIPVVRSTGGLADTIEQYDGARGTGFCFSEYSAKAMMASLRQAISAYSNPYRWNKLVANAMSQDWSWDRSAREYINLYNEILQKRQVKA